MPQSRLPKLPNATLRHPIQQRQSSDRQSQQPTNVVVDPAWILRAVALILVVALLCGYATFCLLFYLGQWQIVLHPTRTKAQPHLDVAPESTPLLHFAPDAAGVPQLTGWWFPADPLGRYRHLTVLYLVSGNGQAARADDTLTVLHQLGLSIFLFDYRGFGQSAGGHPDQASMTEDARSALNYLVSVRGVRENRLVLYGAGVGGSLAVSLAETHPSIPTLILDGPEPNLLAVARTDPRVKVLPVRLLFNQRFLLFPALSHLATPKLILTRNSLENSRIAGDASTSAADPKMTVALPDSTPDLMTNSISRFLDRYAPPTPPAMLTP